MLYSNCFCFVFVFLIVDLTRQRTSFSARVSPQTCQRVVTAAREYLNQVVADVFIYTDHYKGNDAGLSPGFGIALVCESTSYETNKQINYVVKILF